MASFTVKGFQPGATIQALLATDENPSGPPVTSAVASATARADGSARFTGLDANTAYYAYSNVGEHTYVSFGSSGGAVTAADILAGGGATTEELVAGPFFDRSGSANNTVVPLLSLPFAWKLLSVNLVVGSGSPTGGDVDYWTVSLDNFKAADGHTVATAIASKVTRPATGEAFVTNKPWKFDSVLGALGDQTLRNFAVDDTLKLTWTKTGTTATGSANMMYIVRYQPI